MSDDSERPERGGTQARRKNRGRPSARPAKPMTPERLDRIAAYHLQRFATSAGHLRRVLTRRVQRAADAHGQDPDETVAMVNAVIERYQRLGWLDDATYAEQKARALRQRGLSHRRITAYLTEKAVDPDTIRAALDSVDTDMSEAIASPSANPASDATDACQPARDAEELAAERYARRRRLGPYRPHDRAAHRARDMARLGRAGFSYGVACRIIGNPDPDTEPEDCGGDPADDR